MLPAAVAFAVLSGSASAAGTGPTLVRQASSVGVSAPLREVAARAPAFVPPPRPAVWERVNERSPKTRRHRPGRSTDSALQLVAPATTAMPSPSVNFAGLSASNNTAIFGGSSPIPPDPNGDVGPNHYVQMVNTLVRVYSKTGTPLTPFFGISDLFASVGSPCAGTNDGDPIVLYDPLADRWLLSQLCGETTAGRQHELVAISTTPDPTGTYYVYDFILPNDKAIDYPKFGVWPDAYYMTINQFVGDTNTFAGGGAFALDRAKMLVGDPTAAYIYFDEEDINPEVSGQLPTDLDGVTLPPAGAPNLFIDIRADEYGDPADALRMYEFHADFANPAASTFTARTDVPLAAFDPRDTGARNAVAQPADQSDFLDSLAGQMMHRIAYRTLAGGVESYVLNFMVNVSGEDPTGDPSKFQAGIRWVELRRNASTGAVTVNNQGTYAPGAGSGATGRDVWMGSVAQDRAGDIALGFSASSTTLFPSIVYAGRLAGDAAGQLAQGEVTLQAGSGSQTSSADRWGDYSAMSVDPADECTFWYTNEYYLTNSTSNWLTQIGAFKFPSCTAESLATIQGTVTDCASNAPLAGAVVAAPSGYLRQSDGSGTYAMRVAPGSYTVTATVPGYATGTAPVTIAAGQTLTADFCLAPVPVFIAAGASLRQEECLPANHAVDPGETVEMNLCLANTGAAGSGDVEGSLDLSGGIDLSDSQDFGKMPKGGGPVCRPFRLRASGACGTTAEATLSLTNDGSPAGSVTFDIPLGAPVAPLSEGFDGVTAPALPAGWTATNAAGTALWQTSTSSPDSLPNSAFINDQGVVTDKRLTTPSFAVQTASARLTFRQRFDLDEFFDGGVLEVSSPNINSGSFTDVTDAAVGGSFVAGGYGTTLSTGYGNPLGGRAAWTGSSFGYVTTVVDLGPNVAGQTIQIRWRLGTDSSVSGTGWWIDSIALADGFSCCALPTFVAQALSVDAHPGPGVSSNQNHVLEPGETAIAAPTWKNGGAASAPLTGIASAFTGPAGAAYTIADATADYGTVAAGASSDCFAATANCFRLGLSAPASRPVLHWDATFLETLSAGPAKTWTVHVGDSFTDVPRSNSFYAKIETLLHSGITAGCGGTLYCPSDTVTRGQMAIFLARGIAGSGSLIPVGGTLGGNRYFCGAGGVSLFTDVAPTDLFCRHVHFLALENVTQGCAASTFCPSANVARGDMAAFLARAILVPGGGSSIPVSYGPDPVTGLSYSCDPAAPALYFGDVPSSNAFCRPVHYLWARGVIAGCAPNVYCPGQPVTRDQMAKFLSNAFERFLYGP